MTLQGTLDDFGIVELLQIPYNGKKTCRLILNSPDGQATLYYDRGQIVHAQYRDMAGERVIEEIMGWSKGSFELGPEAQPPKITIHKDLHTLLLFVVKSRDEKKFAAQKVEDPSEMLAIKLQTHLKAFLGSGGPAIYLTVMDKSGKVIAEAKNPEKKPDFTLELQQMVAELATHYPRDGFQKALYEDGMGLVSVIRINGSLLLLAISGKDSPVGAVTHGLTRLATQLAQSGEVSANG